MHTDTLPSELNVPATKARALYWELDDLRMHLCATAEEVDLHGSYCDEEGVWDDLMAVPPALREASRSIAEVQTVLAQVVVKTAGPAEPR